MGRRMTSTFYTGKRITVTGGAGFLGSFLLEELERRGATDVFVPRVEDYDLRTLASRACLATRSPT
jgi:nucleoside-diphosphate-sugar epimerase